MLINFNEMEYEAIPELRGGIGNTDMKIYQDENNKIMLTKLEPGCTIGKHTHERNSETYVTISGVGRVILDGESEEIVKPGMVHYCPKGHAHEAYVVGDEPWIYYAQVANH